MKKRFASFIKTTQRILYENKKNIRLIWSVSPFWIIYSCFLQLYEGIYPIFNNYTTKLMIDSVTASLSIGTIHRSVYISLGLIILATVLFHILISIKNYIDVICIDRVNTKINSKIIQKVSEKPYYHFESPDEIDKIERMRVQGSNKCIEQFNYSCSLIFYDVIFGLGTLFIMFKISVIISILFVIVVSIRYIVNTKLARYNHTNDIKLTNTKRKIQYLFNIAVTIIFVKEMKIFNTFDWINKRYTVFCQQYNRAHKKYIRKSLPVGLGSSVASTVLYIMSYYIIITKGISNGYSVGTIIFYTSSLSLFTSFLETLISHVTKIYGTALYTSDLFHLLDEHFMQYASSNKHITQFNDISVKNVSFTYPGTSRLVLKNINMNIKYGEKVCIVGRNGMGKSTLVKLILGLYKPNTGSICIDEQEAYILKEKGVVYASAVFQDYAKYGLTLKENIIFDEEVSDDDVKKILFDVGFSDQEIDNLPDGLQTYLNREYDENGIVLSEGQWQRIAVARAVCRGTPLIILDEPTSNLDPISEEAIYTMMNKYSNERTIIMISHRLSGVISADKIVVIDDGMITGIGTHNELLQTCSIYKEMFEKQANKYLQKI